jgi:hypothetical protein
MPGLKISCGFLLPRANRLPTLDVCEASDYVLVNRTVVLVNSVNQAVRNAPRIVYHNLRL